MKSFKSTPCFGQMNRNDLAEMVNFFCFPICNQLCESARLEMDEIIEKSLKEMPQMLSNANLEVHS